MTQPLRSATIFSLAADPPSASTTALDSHSEFDSATLVAGERRLDCALLRLSAAGATLSISETVSAGDPMTLELANGQGLDGVIGWYGDGQAGFVFQAPVDVIGALARNLASLPAERRALPRVEIQQAASIRLGSQVEFAQARNVSQGGIGIETRLELAEGDTVHITLDRLRPLEGTVRWTRGNQAGIAFAAELGWQTLMPWLRESQRNHPAATPHSIVGEAEGLMSDKQAIQLDAPAQVRLGVHWWNAKVRALTAQLVELETRAAVMPGAQLWVSLPQIGGGPVSVIEAARGRILCEFRLPLRPRELGLLSGGRLIG